VTVLQCAFDYACELLFQEVIYLMRFSTVPPSTFGGLLQESTRATCLTLLEDTYETFLAIEGESLNSVSLRAELRHLVWPQASWVMEVFVCLDETSFQSVDDDMLTELKQWSQCTKTTQIAESGFNTLRANTNVRGKRMSADRVFHTLSKSKLARENDRPAAKITNDAKLAAVEIEPGAFVAKENHNISLGDDLIQKFIDSPVTEQSHDSYLKMPLRWEGLKWCKHNLSIRRNLWLALLTRPGLIIYKKDAGAKSAEGLIIGSSESAIVVLPVEVKAFAGEVYAQLCFAKPFEYSILCVTSMDEYKVI
jgi:hypothetical protein